MPSQKFQRKKEDFICTHCGTKIVGDGYTNHCSKCLWSRHVDINPGDRAANCQGMMKPMSVEVEGDKYYILHQCEVCGYKKRNQTKPEDNFEVILSLCS